MTISSTTNRNNYIGNGATSTYSYTYRIFSQNDLLVTVRNTLDVETTLTLTTDYTVTGVGSASGGTIVLVNASQAWLDSGFLIDDYVLSIRRVRNLTQETDIRNQGDFFPEVHEDALDHLVMLTQQQQDELDRSLKLNETSDPGDFDATLPSDMIGSSNQVFMTNATGDGFEMGPTATEITNAHTYATQANSSAQTALEWASKTDGIVVSTDYSSKAWAIGGTGVTDTASKGPAKDWAIKMSGTVDGTNYSAKYHATAAATSATDAATSATAAQTAVNSAFWRDVLFLTFSDSPVTIVDATHRGKLLCFDCTSGAITVNLPAIAGLNLTTAFTLGIKKTDASGNTVTVNRASTDTIDGATSKVIQVANSGAVFVPDTSPSPDTWTTAEFGAQAGNLTVDSFNGDGSTVNFTLSVSPASENNTWVYIDGVYQEKDTYSLSGTTLTFSEAPITGSSNIEVISGTTLSVGTPSDSTVTKAKLTTGATANLTVTSKTANYTVLTTDQVNLGDATSGSFTYTLPTAVGNSGLVLEFEKTDSSANTVTIDGNGSETIGGSLTRVLLFQNDHLKIVSDNANWKIVSGTKYVENCHFHTHAGYGSTNTMIARFSTEAVNTISRLATTVSNDATNGASITISKRCKAFVSYWFNSPSGAKGIAGISLNSNQLTTSIASITAAHRKANSNNTLLAATDATSLATAHFIAVSGDVIRFHTSGNTPATSSDCGCTVLLEEI